MPHAGVSVYYLKTDGGQWARYIEDKLTTDQYGIVTRLNDFRERPENHIKSLYLNVFVITPDFLDLKQWDLMKEFDKSMSMLVLTGVDQEDLCSVARTLGCQDILSWPQFELSGTAESVRELMISIIKAYETVHDYDRVPYAPRQVNNLKGVVFKEGEIHVSLETVADSCVSLLIEDIHPSSEEPTQYIFPGTDVNKVSVFLNTHNIGTAFIGGPKIETEKSPTNTISISTQTDHTPEFDNTKSETIEDSSEAVDKDGEKTETTELFTGTEKSVGANVKDTVEEKEDNEAAILRKGIKKQSKLETIRALLEEETEPARMLCECLGLEDNDATGLDEKMTSLVTCSETLKHLSFPSGPSADDAHTEWHPSVWPTLLHFGARYNLLMFCDALLSNPLMYSACLKRNRDGHLPHDIARQNKHEELANLLQHFVSFVLAEKDRLAVKSLSSRMKYDSGFSGTPRLSSMMQPYIPEHTSIEHHDNTSIHGALNYKELVEALDRNTDIPRFTFSDEEDSTSEHGKDRRSGGDRKASATTTPKRNSTETETRPRSRSKSPLQRLQDKIHSGDFDQTDTKHISKDLLADLQHSLTSESIAMETKKKGIFSKLFKPKKKLRRGSVPEITIDHQSFRHNKMPIHKSASDSQRSSGSSLDSYRSKPGNIVPSDSDQPPPRPCKSAAVRSTARQMTTKSTGSKSIVEETGTDPAFVDEKDGNHLRESFIGNTWERKSLRIQYAKEDKNLTGPPLPSRKRKDSYNK